MDGFKDTTRMRNMEGGSCFAHGGAVKAPMSKGGQPVQKKSLGGVLEKVAPFGLAGLVAGGGLKGVLGATGIGLIAQLLKKKKSGVPLTPDEQKQVDAAPAGSPVAAKMGGMMKKGGAMKKKGVPVAPRGPLVGLSAMPRGKK